MVSPTDKPRPSHPALAWRQIADEVILVDPTQADTIVRVFNPIGGDIWQRLDGNRDLAGIAVDLAQTYDAPAATIQADLIAFVDELLAKGVLVLG